MRIRVAGFDPSMTHWGMASTILESATGTFEPKNTTGKVVIPKKDKTVGLRQNAKDLAVARELSKEAFKAVDGVKVVFAEVPVGSQTARAMCSYGMVCGILGSIEAHDTQIIPVTATEVKVALTGNANATKRQMIDEAVKRHPEIDWPRKGGRVINDAEHIADALGAIYAGIETPFYKNLIKIYG